MKHPKSENLQLRARSCRIAAAHKQHTAEVCEDTVFLRQTPDLFFYGLADGQSQKPHCAPGGLESLKALECYIRAQGLSNLLDLPFPDELPCMLMRQIRRALLDLSGSGGGAFEDYASTVLAMAVEPATGRFLMIHLGDGCAVGLTRDGRLLLLSDPENRVNGRYTWLTTSETAVPHMRVTNGCLQDLKRIYLMTDGASRLCRGRNISLRGRELMTAGSWQELQDYLTGACPEDDAACIFLEILRADTLKNFEDTDMRYCSQVREAPSPTKEKECEPHAQTRENSPG